MTDPMELVGLVEQRIGQDFDGECHLTADEARQIAACIREMAETLSGFVNAEDDAKLNPMGGVSLGGLMDSRDNSGCVYQSAHLAGLIAFARPLPSLQHQEPHMNRVHSGLTASMPR